MNEKETNIQNSVYSDFTDIGFNLYNFTFYFGVVEEGQSQLLGKIKMSPETAKQFANILNTNIESYEKVYGTINEFTPEVAEKEKQMIEEINKFKQRRQQGQEQEHREHPPAAEKNE